jgi:hypothetical protein
MPEDIIAELIGQAFNVILEAAIAFWNELLEWIFTSMLVWIQADLSPLFAESAKIAFAALTQVTVATYQIILEAWNTLRQVLLEAVVEFHKSSLSSHNWVRNLNSVLIKVLENGQPVLLKREVEEAVSWDNLPTEVRSAWLGSSQTNYKVDVLETREKELQAMSMMH